MSAAVQTERSPGRRRPRGWRALAAVGGAALLYCGGWAWYSAGHLDPYREQRIVPAGEPVTFESVDYRLLALDTRDELVGVDADRQPQPPAAGAVWVVARLAVTPQSDERSGCLTSLVGPERRQWSSITPGVELGRPANCFDPGETPTGTGSELLVTFQVPRSQADTLIGLALDDATDDREVTVLAR